MRSLAWFLQRSINSKFCFRILFKTLCNKLAIKKVKGLHLNRSNFQELLLLAGTHYIIFIHTFDIPLLLFSFSISLDNIFSYLNINFILQALQYVKNYAKGSQQWQGFPIKVKQYSYFHISEMLSTGCQNITIYKSGKMADFDVHFLGECPHQYYTAWC